MLTFSKLLILGLRKIKVNIQVLQTQEIKFSKFQELRSILIKLSFTYSDTLKYVQKRQTDILHTLFVFRFRNKLRFRDNVRQHTTVKMFHRPVEISIQFIITDYHIFHNLFIHNTNVKYLRVPCLQQGASCNNRLQNLSLMIKVTVNVGWHIKWILCMVNLIRINFCMNLIFWCGFNLAMNRKF